MANVIISMWFPLGYAHLTRNTGTGVKDAKLTSGPSSEMKYSWFIVLMVLSKLWILFSLMRIFRMTYLDYQCMRFELLPSQFWLKSYYPKIFACQVGLYAS